MKLIPICMKMPSHTYNHIIPILNFKNWVFVKMANTNFKVNLYSGSHLIIYFLSAVLFSSAPFQNANAQPWNKVPDIDLSKFRTSDFKDDELDIPYYLKHFHTLANSVIETGPDKGFINISVWRHQSDNKPFNARIMENVIALAYFYCTNRPWNPYYNSQAVKLRLEAAIDFICRIQNTNGAFSEYGKDEWNLAAPAFAAKFISETLVILSKGPAIDNAVLQRLKEADRRTILFVLKDAKMYNHGKDYSNQYTNVWSGALAYMSLYPDKEILQKLTLRMKQSIHEFQSPAGYFYEEGGVDYSYNFHTHHSNLWMSYNYCRGTALARIIVEEENKFNDWISYNSTKEPDSNTYTINRAIEMRQHAYIVGSYFTQTSLGEECSGVRAFNSTAEELQLVRNGQRHNLEQNWPQVADLKIGEFSAYTPYTFLHRNHFRWYPSASQRQAAIDDLPYIKRENFIHQKMDSNKPFVFTYIRRPGYYAAFNSGTLLKKGQRFGLGLLWSPKSGTWLQSQTNSDSAAWGTISEKGKLYESSDLNASFKINKHSVHPKTGNHDLEQGVLCVSYPLDTTGNKFLTFNDSQLDVAVYHKGNFTESLPLLIRKDEKIELNGPGKVKLTKSGSVIYISFDNSATATIKKTDIQSGDQKVVVLYLQAHDKLEYSIIPQKYN